MHSRLQLLLVLLCASLAWPQDAFLDDNPTRYRGTDPWLRVWSLYRGFHVAEAHALRERLTPTRPLDFLIAATLGEDTLAQAVRLGKGTPWEVRAYLQQGQVAKAIELATPELLHEILAAQARQKKDADARLAWETVRQLALGRQAWSRAGWAELELARLPPQKARTSHEEAALQLFRKDGNRAGVLAAWRARLADNRVLESFWPAKGPNLALQLLPRLQAELKAEADPLYRLWYRHQCMTVGAYGHAPGMQQALEREAAGGPLAVAACRTLSGLAELEQRYDVTAKWLEKAVALSRRLPPVPLDEVLFPANRTAALLSEQAFAETWLGRTPQAFVHLEEALALPATATQRTSAFEQLFYFQLAAGDRTAGATAERFLAHLETLSDPLARAEGYLSFVYAFNGARPTATRQLTPLRLTEGGWARRLLGEGSPSPAERALATFAEARRLDPRRASLWMVVEAHVYAALGRLAEARESYRQAWMLASQLDGEYDRYYAGATYAAELMAAGQAAEAAAVLRKAAETSPQAGGPTSTLWTGVSFAETESGRPQAGLEAAEQALVTARGAQYSSTAYALLAKALAQEALGQPEAARATMREAVEGLGARNIASASYSLDEAHLALRRKDGQGALAAFGTALEEQLAARSLRRLATTAREYAAVPGAPADVAERALTALLDPVVGLEAAHLAPDELEEVRSLFEAAVSRKNEPAAVARWMEAWRTWTSAPVFNDREVEESRRTYRLLASSGKARADDLARARQDVLAALNRLRQRSPEMARWMPAEYGDLIQLQERLDPDTLVVQYYPGDEVLYLLALTRQGLFLTQLPVPRTQLEATLSAWQTSLVRRQPDEEARTRLSSWLLAPLQAQLEGKQQVWVLPVGSLWYLAFDSLEGPGARSWSSLAPADLATLLGDPRREEGPRVVLAPDVDLPAAEQEARAVADLVGGKLLVRSQATRGSLGEQAQLVHLATHAHTSKDVNRSQFDLADGPLTLQEIYSLRLAHGALVVLSACRTGVGESEPGRAVTSLGSAFRVAGASTVVSSLWPVDDDATRDLLVAFYRGLAAGLGRGEALRRAKAEIAARPQYHSPYYWAGFTLWGDPR